jgi:multisubunit Na+/H+ antiporter MnhF subunit
VIALKTGISEPSELAILAQYSRLRGSVGDPSYSTCASAIRTLYNLLPLFNPEDYYSLRLLGQLMLSTSTSRRPHINRLRLLSSVLILSVLGSSRILTLGLLSLLLKQSLTYGIALVLFILDSAQTVPGQCALVVFMVSCLL